jgi:hypothetical protein
MRTVSSLIGTLLVSACGLLAPSHPPIDVGLFDDPECVVACWQGLRPGQSDMADVEGVYTTQFNTFHIHTNDEHTSYSIGGYYNINSYLEYDNLVNLSLRVHSSSRFTLDIETILEVLGESEYTLVSYGMAVETTSVYPYIKLYYPQAGYIFHADLDIQSRSDDEIEVCIQPNVSVTEIRIVSPGSIDNVVADSFYFTGQRMEGERLSIFVNNLSSWGGYTCYNLEYPPRKVE